MPDDGIVVVRSGTDSTWEFEMVTNFVLRQRLGEDGVRALDEHVEQRTNEWRTDVVNVCTDRLDGRLLQVSDRFEVRLQQMSDRSDAHHQLMVAQLGGAKVELTDRLTHMRVELLRWSFAFWVGQILAIAALLGVIVS
jgi:hypothetical protein